MHFMPSKIAALFVLTCGVASAEEAKVQQIVEIPSISQALVKPQESQNLLDRCDKDNSGDIDPDKIKGYILAINEPLFEKYDGNCDGQIDATEKADYYADARKKADEAFDKAVVSVEERAQKRIAQRMNKPLSREEALNVMPNPGLKSAGIKASFSDIRKPTTNGSNYSFEFTAEQRPWRSYRNTVLPVSIGLDWTLGAKRETETTSTSRTREEEVSFTPFSMKTTDPKERLSLKFSLGAAYVWSEEAVFATGVATREAQPTFAYATELSYALDKDKCWSIGIKYEYKSRHAFSDKVATTLKPMLGFKFVCDDE